MTAKPVVSAGHATAGGLLPPPAFLHMRAEERLLTGAIGLLGLATLLLAWVKGTAVAWDEFAPGIAAALALVATGLYARNRKAAPRLGLAAISVGIFMGFTALSAIFIFALFPLANPLIDHQLQAVDAALGYHWPDFVAWLGGFPGVLQGLGYLYPTALGQIVFLVLLLAFLRRDRALYRLLTMGIVTMVLAIGIWWLLPSIGPSAYVPAGMDKNLLMQMNISPAVGAYFMELVRNGLPVITLQSISGVVAFPSYHMIMALMVTWFAWRTFVFAPLALANLFMIPATLAQGGHYLIDLIGGTLVFLISLWLTGKMLPPGSEKAEE